MACLAEVKENKMSIFFKTNNTYKKMVENTTRKWKGIKTKCVLFSLIGIDI